MPLRCVGALSIAGRGADLLGRVPTGQHCVAGDGVDKSGGDDSAGVVDRTRKIGYGPGHGKEFCLRRLMLMCLSCVRSPEKFREASNECSE